MSCRWINDSGLDFLKVFIAYDSFFYDGAVDFGEEYSEIGVPAVESLDSLAVLTEGGWSIQLDPLAPGGEPVDKAERDAFMTTAMAVAAAAGG